MNHTSPPPASAALAAMFQTKETSTPVMSVAQSSHDRAHDLAAALILQARGPDADLLRQPNDLASYCAKLAVDTVRAVDKNLDLTKTKSADGPGPARALLRLLRAAHSDPRIRKDYETELWAAVDEELTPKPAA